MLSIYTLKSSKEASKYYQKDNYYAKEGDNGYSRWLGRGAELLGLEGNVSPKQFREALEGRLPNGIQMQKQNKKHHRPGYDLTFSAPKSVSVLAIVGQDDRVIQAHRNAISKVLTHIENKYGMVRVKANGTVRIEKTNTLAFATFEHTDSRALDPNLHTHCILMNFTRRKDGQWRTVYGDELYKDKLLNGMEYRAELAKELMALGFSLVQTSEKGTFELADFDEKLIKQFSKRRQQIEKKLEDMGQSGGKIAKVANFLTRSGKIHIDLDKLQAGWDKELQECGSSFDWLHNYSLEAKERGPVLPLEPRDTAVKSVDSAISHLSEIKTTFKVKDVLREAFGLSLLTCDRASIVQEIFKRVKEGELLQLDSALFTTKVAQDLEVKLSDSLQQDKSQVKPLAGKLVAGFLGTVSLREQGQREVLKHLLTSRDKQIGVETNLKEDYYRILKVFNHYCHNEYLYPIGIVQSNEQKEVFKQQTGFSRCYTLSRFLESCREGKKFKPNQPWVLDPNIKLKLSDAVELQEWAKRKGTRLIWSGEITKSNRVFSHLVKNGLSTVSLNDTKQEHDLSSLLSKANIESVLDYKERLNLAIEKFLSMPKGEASLLVTTHSDKIAANTEIRNKLIAKEELGQKSVKAYSLQPLFMSEEQKSLVHLYQPEDVLHVKGNYYYVQDIDLKKGSLTLENSVGETIKWKPTKANVNSLNIYRLESRDLRAGDMLTWTKTMRDFDDKRFYRINGEKAQITSIEENLVSIRLQNGQMTVLNTDDLRQCHYDYGYAPLLSKHAPQNDQTNILLMTANQSTIIESEKLAFLIEKSKQFYLVTDDAKAIKDNLNTKIHEIPLCSQKESLVNESQTFYRLQNALNDVNEKMGSQRQIPIQEVEPLSPVQKIAIDAVDYVCSRLVERSAVFNLDKAKEDAFKLRGLQVSRQEMDAAFTKAFESSFLVNLGENALTTQSMLTMEKGCLEFMREGQGRVQPILSSDHALIRSLKENAQLTKGQREAVLLSLTTEDRVIGIQGIAGAGKTTMLKEVNRLCQSTLTEVNRACTDAGFRLLGLANTAGAKNRIEEATYSLDGTGIKAMTTRKFLLQAEKLISKNPELAKLLYGRNQILVLDEASLVSTRDMFSLLSISKKLDARVLLIGDVKQLGAIEAGNPWQLLLGSEMNSVAMTENVRFKDPNTVAIMSDLYASKIDDAMNKLTKRTIEIPEREELHSAIANLFVARSKEKEDTLVISPRNEDRILINDKIRDLLKQNGMLQGKEVDTAVLVTKDINDAEKKSFYSYQEGDSIRFNFNSRRMGIEAGDYFEIAQLDHNNQFLTLEAKDGRKLIWSLNQMPKWSGAIELFQIQNRKLMVGDKIRWRKNDEDRGIFNGDMADVIRVEGEKAQVQLRNGEKRDVNLNEGKNQHWDHAYTSTVFVAQGQDVPFTIGLCQGPKPYQKKTDDLKIGDTVALPARLQKDENATSKLATILQIKGNELVLKDKDNQFYSLNTVQANIKLWNCYRSFEEIKPEQLPQSSSLSSFLVQATRGDKFMMFVDNLDYFKKTLATNPGIKETVLEHIDAAWSSKVEKVQSMTASVTGKAATSAIDQTFQQIEKMNIRERVSKNNLQEKHKLVDKNL